MKPKLFKKFVKPSHVLIVSQVKNSDPVILKEDYATLAMGIQNFSLICGKKDTEQSGLLDLL